MSRNSNLDLIKAIAIIIIVTCHFFIFSGDGTLSKIGQYLAGVGNFLFLAVSAYLFGLIHEDKGQSAFRARPFLKKRLLRLSSSLWPFLVAVLGIYFFIGVDFSYAKAVMNFLGMGWFGKLPNMGHLWFITMILFCYIMYIVVANSHLFSIPKTKKGWFILLTISITLELIVDYFNYPGYLFVILFYSLFLFYNSKSFTDQILKTSRIILWLSFVVFNCLAILSFFTESFPLSISLSRILCVFAGLSWICILLRYGAQIKTYKLLLFFSVTSFEFYLVHHVLCQGELSIIHTTKSPTINYCMLWSLTIIFGVVLKIISSQVKRLFQYAEHTR